MVDPSNAVESSPTPTPAKPTLLSELPAETTQDPPDPPATGSVAMSLTVLPIGGHSSTYPLTATEKSCYLLRDTFPSPFTDVDLFLQLVVCLFTTIPHPSPQPFCFYRSRSMSYPGFPTISERGGLPLSDLRNASPTATTT